jgi:hypothetical protein
MNISAKPWKFIENKCINKKHGKNVKYVGTRGCVVHCVGENHGFSQMYWTKSYI